MDEPVKTPKKSTPVTVWLINVSLEEAAYVEGAAMSRIASATGLSLSQMYQFYADQAKQREQNASAN